MEGRPRARQAAARAGTAQPQRQSSLALQEAPERARVLTASSCGASAACPHASARTPASAGEPHLGRLRLRVWRRLPRMRASPGACMRGCRAGVLVQHALRVHAGEFRAVCHSVFLRAWPEVRARAGSCAGRAGCGASSRTRPYWLCATTPTGPAPSCGARAGSAQCSAPGFRGVPVAEPCLGAPKGLECEQAVVGSMP